MKHFPFLTKEEIVLTIAMLSLFQRKLFPPLIARVQDTTVLESVRMLQNSLNMHHSVLLQLKGDSIWRVQGYLEASIEYAPLLSHSSVNSGVNNMEERRLHQLWLAKDRPQLANKWTKSFQYGEGTSVQDDNNRIYVLTYGTNRTDGLEKLVMSSIISGLPLEVIGLGKPWRNWGDLIAGIGEFLNSHNDNISSNNNNNNNKMETANRASWSDDDVVVIVDAYDVLLTPGMRRVVRNILLHSDVPIVVSSEEYCYPEELLSWAYPRDRRTGWEVERSRGKFLNSGVIVGQVKYLRFVFQQLLLSEAYIYGNDQHQWARYLVETQGKMLVKIDTSMHLAFSTYKHGRLVGDILQVPPLFLSFYNSSLNKYEKKPAIHLEYLKFLMRSQTILSYHGNNKASIALYDWFWENMNTTIEKYMIDEDREILLQILWAFYDGNIPKIHIEKKKLLQFKKEGARGISALADDVLKSLELYEDVFV